MRRCKIRARDVGADLSQQLSAGQGKEALYQCWKGIVASQASSETPSTSVVQADRNKATQRSKIWRGLDRRRPLQMLSTSSSAMTVSSRPQSKSPQAKRPTSLPVLLASIAPAKAGHSPNPGQGVLFVMVTWSRRCGRMSPEIQAGPPVARRSSKPAAHLARQACHGVLFTYCQPDDQRPHPVRRPSCRCCISFFKFQAWGHRWRQAQLRLPDSWAALIVAAALPARAVEATSCMPAVGLWR